LARSTSSRILLMTAPIGRLGRPPSIRYNGWPSSASMLIHELATCRDDAPDRPVISRGRAPRGRLRRARSSARSRAAR
jgi:hypothetical protein